MQASRQQLATRRLLRGLQIMMAAVLLPAVPIGVAAVRQHRAPRARLDRLARLPVASGAFDGQSEQAAAREHAIIARLDGQGATLFRTKAAVSLGEPGGPTLDQVDAQLPPWPAREEVRAAIGGNVACGRHVTPDRTVELLALAQPVPGGGALYIVTVARHGMSWTAALAALGGGEIGFVLSWLIAVALQRVRGRADGERR